MPITTPADFGMTLPASMLAMPKPVFAPLWSVRTVDHPWFTRLDNVNGRPVVVFMVPRRELHEKLQQALQAQLDGHSSEPFKARVRDRLKGKRFKGFAPRHWRGMRLATLKAFPEFKVDAFTRDSDGTLRYKLVLK